MVNQKIIEGKWTDILNLIEIEHSCSPIAINSWIKPLTIHTMDDTSITFLIGDKFDERAIQFIKSKMYDFYLQLAIEEVTGNKYDINFISKCPQYYYATIREAKAKALFWKYLHNKIELLWD